jgi:DNA invertase Pin-like site-specific DNA recombinase
LVLIELSRMTRLLLDLVKTAKLLDKRQIELVSLGESIDTATATERCFLSMMGAIHQIERELRVERHSRPWLGERPRQDRRTTAH